MKSFTRTEDHRTSNGSAMVSIHRAGMLNRSRVLRALYSTGPISKAELARTLGTNRATIGQIVQGLVDEGLLFERPPSAPESLGGKPPRPIWFAENGWPVAAVLLHSDGAQIGVVAIDGQVSHVTDLEFGFPLDHERIGAELSRTILRVQAELDSPLQGIGVAVAGLVDTESGDIIRVGLEPQFDGMAIASALEAETRIQTLIDGQTRAQALGDVLFGEGRELTSFASVYVGEGIGAGFILNGSLHSGARGAGGEVGHTSVSLDGPQCRCGRVGCWEMIASARWLREEARRRHLGDEHVTASWLRTNLEREDVRRLWQDWAERLAIGIANIQQTLGVGAFIVHGAPVGAGEEFRIELERLVRLNSYPVPGAETIVRFSHSDDLAVLRGAGAIVLSRLMGVAF